MNQRVYPKTQQKYSERMHTLPLWKISNYFPQNYNLRIRKKNLWGHLDEWFKKLIFKWMTDSQDKKKKKSKHYYKSHILRSLFYHPNAIHSVLLLPILLYLVSILHYSTFLRKWKSVFYFSSYTNGRRLYAYCFAYFQPFLTMTPQWEIFYITTYYTYIQIKLKISKISTYPYCEEYLLYYFLFYFI